LSRFRESAGFQVLLFLLHDGAFPRPLQHRKSIMMTKIPALITAALILGSASVASAAVRHQPGQDRVLLLEDTGAYTAPGGAGGYSSDPEIRRLQLLSDKYYGWSEYIR
jgi:hypothetical protein